MLGGVMKTKHNELMTLATCKDTGSLIHVSDVKSGLSCNCSCVDCGADLQAKKGDIITHHFAHHSTEKLKACNWKPETELHLMAKRVIMKDKAAVLPVGTINPSTKTYRFDEVEEEKREGSRIPDLKAYIDGEMILIEIAVTSFCSKEKIAEYKKQNLNVIEFDLKRYKRKGDHISEGDVRDIVSKCPSRLLSISPVGSFANDCHEHNKRELFKVHTDVMTEKRNLNLIIKGREAEVDETIRKAEKELENIKSESKKWYGRMKNSKEIFEKDKAALRQDYMRKVNADAKEEAFKLRERAKHWEGVELEAINNVTNLNRAASGMEKEIEDLAQKIRLLRIKNSKLLMFDGLSEEISRAESNLSSITSEFNSMEHKYNEKVKDYESICKEIDKLRIEKGIISRNH